MRRLALATFLAVFALPGVALAASSSGVVLSVGASAHAIQVIDSTHLVHAYRFRGRLPKLHAGSRITFHRTGQTITHVKAAAGASRTVSFYGTVVRASSRGVVLRLADAKTVSFTAKQLARTPAKLSRQETRLAHAAAGTSVSLKDLRPHETVLISETAAAHHSVTITITSRAAGGPTAPGAPTAPTGVREQQASGVVTEVDTDTFTLTTASGSDLSLTMAPDTLANENLQECDTVDVSYHAAGGVSIADTVKKTGTSTTGDCAASLNPQDETGTITQISASGLTIDTQDQGALTFAVDSSDITDGYQVGDDVDVTYTQAGDGALDASDIEYVEQDATGTVTAASEASITFTDDSTGQPDTFTADPSQGVFTGISVGDEVDVTYHLSSGQQVVDAVDDQTTDAAGSGDSTGDGSGD